ncbi:MAG: DUF5317 family protein [Eubacteriales bacterium]|nr:DUF5317 family protein [Eubacteriales bacterium]MDD3867181.1 DUF5317 family protein [Eubacteriales bacterium]MDD4461545.1 DUF5317 family protein [Eubacteriales bacterium]
MIITAAILGLVLGLLTGGRWRSLLHKRFRLLPLLFSAFILSWLLSVHFFSDWLAGSDHVWLWRSVIAALQLAAMSVFLLVNRRKPGIWFIFAGGLLNGLVIIANGGRMPVGPAIDRFGEAAAAQINSVPHYFTASGHEPLLFLADLYPVWTFGTYMVSLGDFLIAAGVLWLGLYMSRPVRRKNRAAVSQLTS